MLNQHQQERNISNYHLIFYLILTSDITGPPFNGTGGVKLVLLALSTYEKH
jgi:hypothetical protein